MQDDDAEDGAERLRHGGGAAQLPVRLLARDGADVHDAPAAEVAGARVHVEVQARGAEALPGRLLLRAVAARVRHALAHALPLRARRALREHLGAGMAAEAAYLVQFK